MYLLWFVIIQVFGRESLALRSALNRKTAVEGSNFKIGTLGWNTLCFPLYFHDLNVPLFCL